MQRTVSVSVVTFICSLSLVGGAAAQDMSQALLGSWAREEPGWFDAECSDVWTGEGADYGVPVRGEMTFVNDADGLILISLSGLAMQVTDSNPVDAYPVGLRQQGEMIMLDGYPEFPNGVRVESRTPGIVSLTGVDEGGDTVVARRYVKCP